MATANFSLLDLFEQAFGYQTEAFKPKFSEASGYGDGSSTNNLVKARRNFGVSGSPYYANDDYGKEYYLPVTITASGINISLPHPVISVSSRKVIIETPLTELRGTVKELVNVQDYQITIKGFAIDKPNRFPEFDITLLRDLYEHNVPLSIQNPITDIFLLRPDRAGSDLVVIKEFHLPEVKGVKMYARMNWFW